MDKPTQIYVTVFKNQYEDVDKARIFYNNKFKTNLAISDFSRNAILKYMQDLYNDKI